MKAMTVIKSVAFAAVVSALAVASPANAKSSKSKRAYSETGPLIMSGGFGAQASARHSRSADICRPVTIRVR